MSHHGRLCYHSPAAILISVLLAPASLAQDMGLCKTSFLSLQKAENLVHDLNLALDRELILTLAEGSRAILRRLDGALQSVSEGRTPTFLSLPADRQKFAQGVGVAWNPRWSMDSRAYYDAMIRAQSRATKKYEAEADGYTNQMTKDPGKLDIRILEGRRNQAVAMKRDADTQFKSLGCNPQLVAASLEADAAKVDDLAAFGKRVIALRNQVEAFRGQLIGRVRANVRTASKLAADATNAAARAGEHAGALKSVVNKLAGSARACSDADERQREIAAYSKSSADKEMLLGTLLNQAGAIQCAESNAAANIRQKYNDAIKLLGQIGALEKQARAANEQIARTLDATQSRQRDNLIAAAQQYQEAANKEAQNAHAAVKSIEAAATAGQTTWTAGASDSSVTNFHIQLGLLYNDSAVLKSGDSDQARALIDDLKQTVDNISGKVPELEQFQSLKKVAEGQAQKADKAASEAKLAADAIRNALKGCDTKANDDEIAGMARHSESAMNEVSLAAGLRDKAASCEQGPCSSITAGIRPMMEAGQMDNAKSKIDQARAKGCNVKDLDQQFEVYKYIRDAAAAIHQLVSQCRFDEAISFGKKIPEQYHTTLTEDQLALARIGQKKVADVNQLLSEAKAAAARGDQSTASQRIQAAERQASYDGRWYACVEPSIQAAAGVSPTAPTSPVGPGTQPGSTALSAKVEVKQPYQSGSWKYSYSASGGRITYAAADGQINVSSDFAGVPGSLTPGTEFTVTVSGNHSSSPPTAGANVNVTASVEASGLETVSAQSANFKAGGVRPGKYVFRVPSNATSVTLTLHGDFGLGDIATYRYGR